VPSFEQPPPAEPFSSVVSASGQLATYRGSLIACRESLPRVVIPYHPNAMRSTTTKLSANNLTTIFTRRSLR
jgi:hypothetical protein